MENENFVFMSGFSEDSAYYYIKNTEEKLYVSKNLKFFIKIPNLLDI